MINLLAQHVAIVKRELNAGVTERDDLIRVVREWHAACGHTVTDNDCAKMVDVALAAIKNEAKK